MSITKYASLGAASLLAAAVFAGPALADGMPSRGRIADAPAPGPCTFAANVGVTTDYVFRGISQTLNDPAVQGGVEATCGRFYFGFWGSNVDFGQDANVEIDFYGGIKGTVGRFAWDLGVIYYSYPGQDQLGLGIPNVDFLEFKAAGSTEVWKGGTVGATVFFSPDYTFEQGPVWTVEGTFSQVLPRVGIFTPTFGATVGHLSFSDFSDLDYTYWNIGLTLGFMDKWSLDVRYWDTDIEGGCAIGGIGRVCDERVVGTVKYTF